jgi:regulatory protein
VPRAATSVPAGPDDARKSARAAALRLLAGREMSSARLAERLRSRGFSEETIADAVACLTKAHMLDDVRAAQAAARTLVTVRHRGRHRVARELERLGFAHETARDAAEAVLAEADERAVLGQVVASKLRGLRAIPDPASYRRLCAALLRRGFHADHIREALRPFWGHQHEPEE